MQILQYILIYNELVEHKMLYSWEFLEFTVVCDFLIFDAPQTKLFTTIYIMVGMGVLGVRLAPTSQFVCILLERETLLDKTSAFRTFSC